MEALLSPELKLSAVGVKQQPSASLVFKHYAVSALFYGLLLGFLAANPWFRRLANTNWGGVSVLQLYAVLYLLYVLFALPALLQFRPRSVCHSKNLLAFGVLRRAAIRLSRGGRAASGTDFTVTDPEKQALMFLLLRFLFGPLMLSAVLVELGWCQRLGTQLHPSSFIGRLDLYYILFVHVIFLADAGLYAVGFHTEAACLKNEVHCVDTNLWRVLVCLVCYPPFNQATLSMLGASYQDPYILVNGNFHGVGTWSLRLLAVFSLCLLISATLSLFTRASNLTHRGIVTWGPYRFVRHPAYVAQNLFWLITLVPLLLPNPGNVYFTWPRYWLGCLCTLGGFCAWAGIFFLRAVTEEQFLIRDPDYVAYCQRVKYRFIPGVC